jgi:hypothetical protein
VGVFGLASREGPGGGGLLGFEPASRKLPRKMLNSKIYKLILLVKWMYIVNEE